MYIRVFYVLNIIAPTRVGSSIEVIYFNYKSNTTNHEKYDDYYQLNSD